MKAEHIYFPGLTAWRRAFLELLEQEQPEEIRTRGVETEYGPYFADAAPVEKEGI